MTTKRSAGGSSHTADKPVATPRMEFTTFIAITQIAEAIEEITAEIAADPTKAPMPEMTIESLLKHPKVAKAWTAWRKSVLADAAKKTAEEVAKKAADEEAKKKTEEEKKVKVTEKAKTESKDHEHDESSLKSWGKWLLWRILIIATLVGLGIYIGSNGGQAQLSVGDTTVRLLDVRNPNADRAAAVNSQSILQQEIAQLKAAHIADIESASRAQEYQRGEISRLNVDNNALSGPNTAGEFRKQRDKALQDLAQVTRDYEERLRGAEEELGKQSREHAAECSRHIAVLQAENVAAITSKDVILTSLRWQLSNDQLLLESYRATATDQMSHLGERVNVDVVAFAPNGANFEISLDSGLRTEGGEVITQTVTGTNNGQFPLPTAVFQTNAGQYTASRTINGKQSESWRQFIGTAGETIYMNLNGQKAPGTNKLLFRSYTFPRATVLIWTGSCLAIRANPRSNVIPLPNGSVVALADGTMIEVQNGQPTQLASAR